LYPDFAELPNLSDPISEFRFADQELVLANRFLAIRQLATNRELISFDQRPKQKSYGWVVINY
jgi:hypothetical protein